MHFIVSLPNVLPIRGLESRIVEIELENMYTTTAHNYSSNMDSRCTFLE